MGDLMMFDRIKFYPYDDGIPRECEMLYGRGQPPKTGARSTVAFCQSACNDIYGSNLEIDGRWGSPRRPSRTRPAALASRVTPPVTATPGKTGSVP